jgi:hypothetical protein
MLSCRIFYLLIMDNKFFCVEFFNSIFYNDLFSVFLPSRPKTKKLHESASSRGHFLQILQPKLLTKVTLESHREWYHQ